MLGKGAGGCRASRSSGLAAPVSDQLSQDNMQCVQGISGYLKRLVHRYVMHDCSINSSSVGPQIPSRMHLPRPTG